MAAVVRMTPSVRWGNVTNMDLDLPDGIRVHVAVSGEGPALLLLHGWPTSSHLWRAVIPHLAPHRRVIAIDLPGFGRSDKPPAASYSFRFFGRVLDGVLERLGVREVGLCVHDLGGPIGLHWGSQHPDRVRELAILNTVVFPEMSWAVKAFVMAAMVPGIRHLLTSPSGVRWAMRLGTTRKLARADLDAYAAPFVTSSARVALARAGRGLHPAGFRDIVTWLERFDRPVRLIYGAKDRILPDIAKTMRRLSERFPSAELTALPSAGHFLQEDAPEEVGRLLADFLSASRS